MENLVLVFVLFLLFFLSAPIYIALFLTSLLVIVCFTTIDPMVLAQVLFRSIDKFSLLAVPFFILTGDIMARGSIAVRLVKFTETLVGFLPGGLAIAGVAACGLFGSISGSTIATMVAIGGIMIPAMMQRGYDKSFTLGIMTAAPILGIIIPPSVPLIIYALLTSESVGELFMAGFVPGLLIILGLCLYVFFYSKKRGVETRGFPSGAELWEAVKAGAWALLLPIIIFGGIFSGVFTVTEAAAVSAFYALFVEKVVYRDLPWKDIPNILIHSGLVTSSFVIIITGASCLAEYLTIQRIPQEIAESVVSTVKSPFVFLLISNIILLVVGTFIDIISAILLLTPIFIPILSEFNVDPVHFGLLMTVNLGIGYITPPLGVLLYIGMQMGNVTLIEMMRSIAKPLLILFVILLILTYIPWFTMVLPEVFYR
ncbi:TRAP proton/solute symporter, large membrane protein component [uncultured Desulfatiglans sp.]|uniref:TRAP proton/solute symporter, large membrane protein component n=1 Tax=Uncultured Desulfatiglans sp. TaxID=1748965 RepID=A0A653A6F3_UNCDX|nr:TRAP proton/solute symporter, large membrane protein component [uncultured Desulfatiglans sp.]